MIVAFLVSFFSLKQYKKYFQVLFYSNVWGHFWLQKAQGMGCIPPTPPFPKVLPFQKTSFRDITFDWDFKSIVSAFLIFWTFIGHWFSAMSDRVYSSSVKKFILKVMWAYFRSLFLRLPEQHCF